MLTLIKYEFLKLAKTKINIVAMLLGWGVIAASLFSSFQSGIWDESGEFVYGKTAVRAYSESAGLFKGPVTNENIAKNVADYQEWLREANIQSEDDVHDPDNPGFEFARSHKAYSDFMLNFLGVNRSELEEMDLDSNPDFYQMFRDSYKARFLDKVDEWIPIELTEKEKEYWINKSNQITDLNFDNVYVWMSICEDTGLCVSIIFIFVILVSMVYTREYKSKTDMILLTTKYGKTKLLRAKNIASFLYFLLYFVLCVALFYGIQFGRYGSEGMNASIQILYPSCMFDVTVFQMSLIKFITYFAVAFAAYAVTVFVSARAKSVLMVCGVGLVLEFIMNFFVFNYSNSSLLNRLLYLLPIMCINLGDLRPVSYPIFGMVFNVHEVAIALYLFIGILFLFFAGRGFRVRSE